ncbi:hypothetical protein VNO77_30924 [Canavalia gladiata]|uniref:Uncharacterized protein n=1 Tax=Canavalia gladiata TaxID=3824 RepID=A0AAN9Q4G1_CANGL
MYKQNNILPTDGGKTFTSKDMVKETLFTTLEEGEIITPPRINLDQEPILIPNHSGNHEVAFGAMLLAKEVANHVSIVSNHWIQLQGYYMSDLTAERINELGNMDYDPAVLEWKILNDISQSAMTLMLHLGRIEPQDVARNNAVGVMAKVITGD